MAKRSGWFVIRQVLAGFLIVGLSACATHSARQTPDERGLLKTALVEGEYLIRANSCSRVPAANFLAGGKAVFGSCYLTNLRLIYEESEWAKTLAAVAKAVPTQGDFGIEHLLKGAYNVFNARYVIEMGKKGELRVVSRPGRVIIPLSDIRAMSLSGSRFSSVSPDDPDRCRWLTIETGDQSVFVFEIYNLPPDKTGMMPVFESGLWRREIDRVRSRSFD
ncbi:hypothetical protein JCM14469_13790 [Desulfatiferula olefinivorans]